jgi:hypothetical protein
MEFSIHRFFTPEEVKRLERGLPRLREWSEAMLVPFAARRLRNPTILWINQRWFLKRHIDVSRKEVRARVSEWLLEEFAFAAPTPNDPEGAFMSESTTLYADRYGSSTGRTIHGGSGRVATLGCFQAKGVGVTPLVGVGGDPEHATGYSSVEEGIREAIFSEVAAAEFPHGAVPVIAILGTGLHQPTSRAIVVRPAVLRIAHAERAPLFVRSRTGEITSQLDDARRTRDVVQRWPTRPGSGQPTELALPDLDELMHRLGEQVAFGQVHRLFSGGYFSSNVSATGALLDFGGMRALPNWANARNLDAVVGFGDEMKIVNRLIESMCFFCRKYSSTVAPATAAATTSAAELRSRAQAAYEHAFTRECLRMWGLDPQTNPELTSAMAIALRGYFSRQQRIKVNYKRGEALEHGWLYDELVGSRRSTDAPNFEAKTLSAVRMALRAHFYKFTDGEMRSTRAWSSAARYLMPRQSLDRERLQKSIETKLTDNRDPNAEPDWVTKLIRDVSGQGRRHWAKLPVDLVVRAHVAYDGSSALLCLDPSTGRDTYWLEGLCVNGTFRFFGRLLRPDQAEGIGARAAETCWTARYSPSTPNLLIPVPRMQVEYAPVGRWHVR